MIRWADKTSIRSLIFTWILLGDLSLKIIIIRIIDKTQQMSLKGLSGIKSFGFSFKTLLLDNLLIAVLVFTSKILHIRRKIKQLY